MVIDSIKFLESKIKTWGREHLVLLFSFGVFILSIIARYSLIHFVSYDAVTYYLPWHEEIIEKGRIGALAYQIGNYNLTFQFISVLLSYLPIEPLLCYKLLPSFFDYVLAILVGHIVYHFKHDQILRVFASAVVIMNPVVILNSACWGQCDSIYTTFCIGAIYAIIMKKKILPFIFYGIALAFKLQAIFLLPFMFWVWLESDDYKIYNLLISPLSMIVCCLPNILMGHRSVKDIARVYIDQTGEYPRMIMNYPSFWRLFSNSDEEVVYLILRNFAIVLTVFILLFLLFCFGQLHEIGERDYLYIAFFVVYTCVLFLPAMHERYGFIYEILAIIIMFFDKKTIIPVAILFTLSILTYSHFLFDNNVAANYAFILTVVNIGVYLFYLVRYFKVRRG